ncbi:MAG: class I SAM-dependent methyltransferase [Mycobacterium sp.]
MTSSLWSAGRYEAVAEQIAGIATTVVAAADQRRALREADVVDLACGTGSAALAAARLGAQVTAVDITPDLLEIGARKADAAGLTVQWRAADAADTGLPAGAFDAAVSNMGIIFVEPQRQVTELARVLKPAGVLSFSSWVRDSVNPFFDPIVSVLGAPPASGYRPDQWGRPDIVTERLTADFEDIDFAPGQLTWRFDSHAGAMTFVTQESPMHVATLGQVDDAQRDALVSAFAEALAAHTDGDGTVSFDASYVVVTAIRR